MNKTLAAGATNNTDTEIANRITALADANGLDKIALAERIGLSYSTLRRSLEQHRGDNRSFTLRELARIADLFEVKPAALLPETFTDAA